MYGRNLVQASSRRNSPRDKQEIPSLQGLIRENSGIILISGVNSRVKRKNKDNMATKKNETKAPAKKAVKTKTKKTAEAKAPAKKTTKKAVAKAKKTPAKKTARKTAE